MKSRIPLIVAVVGALLIGGATTGSTRASWTDQVVQAGDGITAGKIGFTRSLNKASFAVNKTTATTDTVEITVTDESLGKNMVQRITPTVTPGAGVTAVLRTRVSGSCTATTQLAVNLSPGGQFTTCVVVTVDPTTTLTASSVTVALESRQMRGGSPAGWRAPTQTFDIPVAIAQASNAPRSLTCTGDNVTSATLTWQAPASGSPTSYELYFAASGSLLRTATSPAGITEADLPGNANVVVGVRAVYAGNVKSTSNPTVEFSQNQGQGGRVTCGTVTNP